MSRITRFLARLLGRERGEVRTLQDLTALEGVFRFAALFGVTVIVPAFILAYFALTSIRAEELFVDADIDRRADAIAQELHHDFEVEFQGFEESTTFRLAQNQSPLTALSDLSPYLRVAFRFDADGTMLAPVSLPDGEAPPEASTHFRRSMVDARRLELAGRWSEAASAYSVAARGTTAPEHAGAAAFARARALRGAGRTADAEQAFADIYADFANTRDPYGFQIGDLATLERAELALERDPEVGMIALQELVERLLASRWMVGEPGEAAVARRALSLLEPRVDSEWLGRTRSMLNERTSQLFWAERLADELELLVSVRASGEHSPQFQYIERPESNTLWATVWWQSDLYAFAFDHRSLVDAAYAAAARASQVDEDMRVVVDTHTVPPEGTRTARSLGPWLPSYVVSVGPSDPQSLGETKARKRAIRIVIVFIAVGMSVVGVTLSTRLVRRELENARMKADFAANVSHELRSPITQIRLKGEALQLGLVYDDADRQQHYDAVVHEAERLSRLVDNVLDFSAIERGAKRYTFRPEDLGEIIHNTVESTRNAVESRGIDIQVDVPDDLPVVWLDREAVSQVITNLLSNAAKYGAEGGWVGVIARVAGNRVELAISDRGVGISKDDQKKIFNRFYRSADPRVRRYRGTGIGLTIVQYIVEEHGGEIRVDSAPDRGTTFTITFSLQPRESGA